MELCIRSQDKTQLGLIVGLILVDNEIRGFTTYNHNYFELGKYKTKKRALEVFNEIQNILNLKDMYKYDRELVLKSWENVDEEQVKIVRQQMSVYEMPNE